MVEIRTVVSMTFGDPKSSSIASECESQAPALSIGECGKSCPRVKAI
jgi:hypothetical protein